MVRGWGLAPSLGSPGMVPSMESPSKARRIVTWVLTGALSAMYLLSAVMKLTQNEAAVAGFADWGPGYDIRLIGAGELVSAVLFLIPRTNSLGVLLLSAYMGGAIATHMQWEQPYLVPSIFLVLVWVAGWLRNPRILGGLLGD